MPLIGSGQSKEDFTVASVGQIYGGSQGAVLPPVATRFATKDITVNAIASGDGNNMIDKAPIQLIPGRGVSAICGNVFMGTFTISWREL